MTKRPDSIPPDVLRWFARLMMKLAAPLIVSGIAAGASVSITSHVLSERVDALRHAVSAVKHDMRRDMDTRFDGLERRLERMETHMMRSTREE